MSCHIWLILLRLLVLLCCLPALTFWWQSPLCGVCSGCLLSGYIDRSTCATVHGDLHPENVLLQVPPSERLEEPHSRPNAGQAAALAASALDSEQCTAKISNFGLSILFQDGLTKPGVLSCLRCHLPVSQAGWLTRVGCASLCWPF
jgi:hypothetical protein